MTIETIKSFVTSSLQNSFPEAKVVFQQGDYGPGDLLVFAFNVDDNSVKDAKRLILDIDWRLCSGTGISLTPHVKSVSVTSRHYPQHIGSPLDDCAASPTFGSPTRPSQEWTPVTAVCPLAFAVAANEELALAA